MIMAMDPREPKSEGTENLIRGLQAKDPAALRRFVEEYGPRIQGFLYCLVHSREIAEDLSQEVILRIFRKCGQLRSMQKFETWLFTLARNVAYKEMKHKRYKAEIPMEQTWFDTRLSGETGHPVRRLSSEEASMLLSEAFGVLDYKPREIMALRYYSGLSLQAIAAVMNIPLGSVGTTIKRSLEKLKKYFDSKGIKLEDLL